MKFGRLRRLVVNSAISTDFYLSASQLNMRSFVEVIGCGSHDCSSSVQLFFDNARYLFECGDGTQRVCTELGTKLSRLRGIYLSSLSAPSIGGLFGLVLTIADAGKQCISIAAPTGLTGLFNSARSFCYRPALVHTFHQINLQSPPSSLPITVSHDENVTIEAVPINSRRDIQIETGFGLHFDAVSYICRLRDIRGKFDPQRAQQLGVKKGRSFGLLQKGQSVTTDDGTVVKSADVMSPDTPGPLILVIACPSKHHISSLTSSQPLQPCSLGLSDQPAEKEKRLCVLFHLASREVLSDPKYCYWRDQFGSGVTHIALHSSMARPQATYLSQGEDIAKLHFTIDKKIFPLPTNLFEPELNYSAEQVSTESLSNSERIPFDQVKSKEVSRYDEQGANPTTFDTTSKWLGNWIEAECKLRFNLSPASSFGLERSFVRDDFVKWTGKPELLQWRDTIPEGGSEPKPAGDELDTPRCITTLSAGKTVVRFFGTGAAIPGKHRNVSGIMIDLFERGGILLDCGEGTWGQMVRLMGLKRAQRAVTSLRIIFISHMHADHHLGLLSVLHWRSESIRERKELGQGPQLVLIGPSQLQDWLQAFEAAAQVPLREELRREERPFRFFNAKNLTDPQTIESRLFGDAFGLEVGCVEVIHCPNSYGIVIKDCLYGWKVVYSGDTRPCQRLAEVGKGATLAIHEATLEDEMNAEAKEKMHCTVGEALKVCSEDMGAWRTILTHFSQRYPRLPCLTDATMKLMYKSRAAIAMDFMCVDFTDLVQLPRVVRALKSAFPEESTHDINPTLDAINE